MKRVNLISLAVVVITGLVFLSSAFAETLIVPTQYPTIQAAIDAANPDDTILVLPGEYYIDDQINVNKDLKITSDKGSQSTTLLATENLGSTEYVFLIMTGTTSATAIEGFTVRATTPNNTFFVGSFGCQPNTNPTIQNNVIQGNVDPIQQTGTSIYGIYVNNASPIIGNNVISDFSYGIKLVNSNSVEIDSCIVYNNITGINLFSSDSVTIKNCIVHNNTFMGINFAYSLADILNCTIVYNSAVGLWLDASGVSVKNSIVYANNPTSAVPSGASNFAQGIPILVTYSDIGGASVYPGVGNINADPLFVNPVLYDYHLQLGSPCIDAGDPNSVYNDPEDLHNPGMALYPALGTTRNDMGAYGGLSLVNPPSFPPPATRIVPTQYPTIQAAINAANTGDIILVEPGEYTIDNPITVDKDLTIKSARGPENTTLLITINNFGYGSYVFTIMTGTTTTSATTIEGFTISPATAGNACFGGIKCEGWNIPTIANNVIQGGPNAWSGSCGIYLTSTSPAIDNASIRNNIISGFGCGIYVGPNVTADIDNCIIHSNINGTHFLISPCTNITNCTIYNNTIGIASSGTTGEIKNCTIYSNSQNGILITSNASAEIAECIVYNNTNNGIYVTYSSQAEIDNCISHNNYSGISVDNYSSADILNCTVVYNVSAGLKLLTTSSSLTNSIVYANNSTVSVPSGIYNIWGTPPVSLTYSDIGGTSIYPGEGNINADPFFINSASYDYRLQSTSPCVDAGNPNPVYNDPEDLHNPGMALYPAQGTTRNDMGAYGGPESMANPAPPTTRIVPTQYPAIQAAINAANTGDIILVEPGEYTIDNSITVDKDLTIKSARGPESTTLLATENLGSTEYVFLIMTGTTSTTTVEGFTISPATPSSTSFLGFGCQSNTRPTIANNIIQGTGSNIYGIFGTYAHPLITNNVISGFGHGIYVSSQLPVEIENCTVVYNGTGVYVAGVMDLKNSIVYANNSTNLTGAGYFFVTYSDIGGASVYPGEGNINALPLFVDPQNNNYHLQLASPCIDAGDPNPVYNDPEDPHNPGMALYPALGTLRNDMGAYGGPGIIIE